MIVRQGRHWLPIIVGGMVFGMMLLGYQWLGYAMTNVPKPPSGGKPGGPPEPSISAGSAPGGVDRQTIPGDRRRVVTDANPQGRLGSESSPSTVRIHTPNGTEIEIRDRRETDQAEPGVGRLMQE